MKRFPFLFILLAISSAGYAQHGFDNSLTHFSNITNYVDVNRNNLLVTNAGSDLANDHYSVLKLGTELAKFGRQVAPYNTPAYNLATTPTTILGKYTAYRIEYTEPITCWLFGTTRLRSMIARPNTALPNAPMVLISHGLRGNLGDFYSSFNVQVADLLMRGFVVMFYENLGSSRTLNSGIKIHDAVAISGNLVSNVNYLQHLMYLNGEAAAKLAASSIVTTLVGTDPNKLFTLGFSLGSGISSTLLFGSRNNFAPTLNDSSLITPKDEFTYVGVRNTTFNVKAGIILGGSLAKLKNGMTNIVDPSDVNKRWLSIFGTEDENAFPYIGSADFDGYLDVDVRLTAVGIKHYMNPICGAGHTLLGTGMTTEHFFQSHPPMVALLATVSNTGVASINTTIPASNATLQEFKIFNTLSFQIGSTVAKFITNTIANSATAMNFCENVEHINSINSEPTRDFESEQNWRYWFENICGGIIYNRPCTWVVSRQASPEFVEEGNSIDIHPNPASGIVTITYGDTEEIDLEINLLNLQGTQVQSATLPKGSKVVEMDLSHILAGIYLVRMHHADGHMSTQKLVKQ